MSLEELLERVRYEPASLGAKPLQDHHHHLIEQALNWQAAKDEHHILPLRHAKYPPQLSELPDPPVVLFVKGDLKCLTDPALAMVGSRRCTPGGAKVATELAASACDADLTVVSGLAQGIDTHAHKGALSAKGRTIAVQGCGLERVYPSANRRLADQIVDSGALVSECWPEQAPQKGQFPKRNRIISGLSLGTLVVEAAVQSGSLITARLAAEQGREVFAVPGSILSEQSGGCHRLIQQGAKLVTGISDVLEELPGVQRQRLASLTSKDAQQTQLPFRRVLDSVGFEVTDLDSILESSGLAMELVLEQLLTLELQGWISAVPGGYVRLKRS
ncbi:DNA-processing protein DprA [Paraferrimonas sedimenticola]|uniref:DNA-processing protein DprA n=1 Tax=Paraferrimonas sedimenticola TaxID=375674 RepID=UPI000BA989A3|nr:DNA-processing protein DprA [Paraferrimonas sedimenticola]